MSTSPRHIPTRLSSRSFGLDLTNLPLPDPKRPKAKPRKSSFATEWLQSLPEVQPYLQEISAHTRHWQHQSYIPSDYMPQHQQITVSMRELLVGWMVEVHQTLCHNPHTLYLAVLIVDKFCQHRTVQRARYQLLGISALFVAAKYEELRVPKLRAYFESCGGEYSYEQILGMQGDILLGLGFKIKAMTNCWHMEQYMQLASIQGENRILCQYLLDLSLIEFSCCLVRPTLLCWSIVLFAIKTRALRPLSLSEIQQHFHIQASSLKQTAALVSSLFQKRREKRFRPIQQKYLMSLGHIIT